MIKQKGKLYLKKTYISLLAAGILVTNIPIISHADSSIINNAIKQVTIPELPEGELTTYQVTESDKEDTKNLETFEISSYQSRAVTVNSYASTYGRSWLEQFFQSNSQKKNNVLKLYDQIVTYLTAFQNSTDNAEFRNNQYYFPKKLDIKTIAKEFTVDEFQIILSVILADHPELYSTQAIYYVMDGNENIIELIGNCPPDYARGTDRQGLNQQIEATIQTYLDEIAGLRTDLEKEIAIHNKMLEMVTYESVNPDAVYAHNIVSVFDTNPSTMPVCEGYAKAFQLLMNACGIENIYVTGTSRNQGHAWNIVKLDGKYYNVDVTWNDGRYETIEKQFQAANPNQSYSPLDVAKWAEKEKLSWKEKDVNTELCTPENVLYYYFNKVSKSFTDEHTPSDVFNLNGTGIQLIKQQYSLPAMADKDYDNTTTPSDLYTITYDNSSKGNLTLYNNGVEIKSGVNISAGTIISVDFEPADMSLIYTIYANNEPITIQKNGNKYVGTFQMKSKGVTITIEDKEPEVTGVTLDKTLLTFTSLNTTQQLHAIILPHTAQNQNVTWKSDNTNVAVVDSNGLVRAVANGTANIIATTEEGNKTAECMVTVDTTQTTVNVTGVQLNTEKVTLYKIGETSQLAAILLPTNATNQNVTWKSDNPNIVTVNSSGTLTAVAEGTAHITVTTEEGNKTAVCTVTVNTKNPPSIIPVAGVSLDKSSINLYAIPATERVIAAITPSNATNQTVTFTSSNPKVATINSKGEVTSAANGTAILTVITEDGAKTASCTVTVNTVNPPSTIPVTGIALDKNTLTLSRVGATNTIKSILYPSNATNQKVIWKSDNTSAATVDTSGVVKAIRSGTATITATTEDGNYIATCLVTVKTSSSNDSGSGSGNGSSSSRPSGPSNNTIIFETGNIWESGTQGWRYRDSSGQYVTDSWSTINGKWYHFGADSYMQKGWFLDTNGTWYYLDPINGDMKNGWQKINEKWYLLDGQSGAMKTGWQNLNGTWYFLDSANGEMKTQWNMIDSKWYYFSPDGAMLTGWQKINGNWYYMTASGDCLMDTVTPDGYKVDKNGVWK